MYIMLSYVVIKILWYVLTKMTDTQWLMHFTNSGVDALLCKHQCYSLKRGKAERNRIFLVQTIMPEPVEMAGSLS